MMMKKIFALILSLMLLALPCMAMAEDSSAVIGGADGPTAIMVAESKPILSMTVKAHDRDKDLYKGKEIILSVTVTNESQQAVTDLSILNNATDDVWKLEQELPAGESKIFTLKYTFMKDEHSQDDEKEDKNAPLKDEKIEFKANIGGHTAAEASLILSPYRNPLTITESLVYMGKGLVGIFLVTAMIILVLRILEKATAKKEEPEQ